MTRIHHDSKAALDLEAGDIRVENRRARSARELTGGENRRNERTTGMRQRDKTHVVVVVRMSGHAVCKSGVGGA
jgi:hypothetical protein